MAKILLILFLTISNFLLNKWQKNCSETALNIVHSTGEGVSLEAQTRTNETHITVLQHTLTHVNLCWISFGQEKPKHVFLISSSSTKWCFFNCSIPKKLPYAISAEQV